METYAVRYKHRIRLGKEKICRRQAMNKELYDKERKEIDDFRDKLGEVFYDSFNEEDNNTCEMGKGMLAVLGECQTEREFEIADAMIIAVCGYGLETLISRIKERDNEDYVWESL